MTLTISMTTPSTMVTTKDDDENDDDDNVKVLCNKESFCGRPKCGMSNTRPTMCTAVLIIIIKLLSSTSSSNYNHHKL